MQKLLQRIRGTIGMGVTWAAVWSAAGAVPRWVLGIDTDAPLPLIFGMFGLIAGMIFAGILALAAGRRRLDQLTLPSFAGWGAVGGVVLSAIFGRAASLGSGELLALASTLAVASATCAAGSLALARRADRRELPHGRVDAIDPQLTDDEKRDLLGRGD